MKTLNRIAVVGGLATLFTMALAAVTFDASSGTGFVGKGDVQLTLGLNNAQLQNASLSFAAVSTTVSEVEWTCTNTRNENTQERARTTTTEIAGVLSSTARLRNQITGFNLNGYSGSAATTTTTDGPQLNSCPTNWVLTSPAGDPVLVSSESILTVNGTPIVEVP